MEKSVITAWAYIQNGCAVKHIINIFKFRFLDHSGGVMLYIASKVCRLQ